MIKDKYRQAAKVSSVYNGREDHGIKTISVVIDYEEGGTQGFGNLFLNDDDLRKSFINDLCDTFDVDDLKDMVGKKCFALFSFGRWNETIEGLEHADSGNRFVLTTWRKKHFKDIKNPLEAEQEALKDNIARYAENMERCKAKLKTLDKEYKAWA